MTKKFFCIVCTVLMSITGICAHAAPIKAEYDYIANTIYISGKTNKANATVAINILKPGVEASDLYNEENPENYIFYNGEFSSDDSGSFSVSFKSDVAIEEGEHKVYLGSKDMDKTEIIPMYILKTDTYKEIIETLNSKSSYEEFDDYFKSESQKIGFKRNDVAYNEDNVIKTLYDYVQKTKLNKENSIENKKIFNSSIMIDTLKTKTVFDNFISDIYLQDNGIVTSYETYINSEKAETYLLNKLFNDSITGVNDLESSVRDAMILTVVKYPNGQGNIKNIFTEYNHILNADISKANLSDYGAIAGKDFNSVAECVSAFNAQVAATDDYQGGGGHGGSSGGRGGSTSGGGSIAGGVIDENINLPKVLNIKFEDLNSVQWAYKAISVLFEKGIINGKSETLFMPNDQVTREEFVKMIVCAFSLNDKTYENVFSDVDTSAWYAPYVSVAYQKGICNGVGENKFGIGENITRQDMCVMLYNALNTMGIECLSGELTFDDSKDFSEYSKEAVSSLAASKIVNGIGDNLFNPGGQTTRAEAAMIIYNTVEYATN